MNRRDDKEKQFESKTQKVENERSITIDCVRKYGSFLRYASRELKGDKEVVMAAVQKDGSALKFASRELKDDKEVVITAVQKDGSALKFASEELKGDKEVVTEAVKNVGCSLQYASAQVKNDLDMMLLALKTDSSYMSHIPASLSHDKKFMMKAVESNAGVLLYMSPDLCNDIDIAIKVAKNSERALFYLPKRMSHNCLVLDAALNNKSYVSLLELFHTYKDKFFTLLNLIMFNAGNLHHVNICCPDLLVSNEFSYKFLSAVNLTHLMSYDLIAKKIRVLVFCIRKIFSNYDFNIRPIIELMLPNFKLKELMIPNKNQNLHYLFCELYIF